LLAPPTEPVRSRSDSGFHFTVVERHPVSRRSRVKVGRDLPPSPGWSCSSSSEAAEGSSRCSSPSMAENDRPTILSILRTSTHWHPEPPPVVTTQPVVGRDRRSRRVDEETLLYRTRSRNSSGERSTVVNDDREESSSSSSSSSQQQADESYSATTASKSPGIHENHHHHHHPVERPDASTAKASSSSSVASAIASVAENTLKALEESVSVTCCCLWTVAAYEALDSLHVGTERCR